MAREIVFFKNHAENETGRIILSRIDCFCFFKKGLCEVKAISLQLSFNIFRYSSTWHTIKTTT